MVLIIKINGKNYLTEIKSDRYNYSFRFKERDGEFDFYSFNFQKFRCSLKCRLNHYKEFKRRVTGESRIGSRNTILIDKYISED